MDILYTPSDFVEVFNQSIDYAFPTIVIEGEISSFRIAKNRWVYFDIKDESASLRCFGTVYILPGPLEDGMLVKIVCSPKLHPTFNFSLQIQSIVPVGEGELAKASQLLYKKLESEGAFLPDRKRIVPYAPEIVCVITSKGSAAHADFVKITSSRWPALKLDTIDSLVQGVDAPLQLVQAIEQANAAGKNYDALVIVRGGGSADDLAAFSDERVVRALLSSRLPTCVAIGHETDESLAELVCDLRGSTPSNLAELLVPDKTEEIQWIESARSISQNAMAYMIDRARTELVTVKERINKELSSSIRHQKAELEFATERLELLNPIAVLKRGYSIVRQNSRVIKVGATLKKGDVIDIMFTDTTKQAEIQ